MSVNVTSIPFSFSDLDAKKSFDFQDTTYKIRLRQNTESGNVSSEESFFSLDVFSETDIFLFSSKISYKFTFVDSILPGLLFQILPIDPKEFSNPQNAESEITEENLGVNVLLVTGLEEA